jgi:hypothetical protein
LQCPCDGGEDVFRYSADVAFLEARVPFGAHTSEHGDFFAAQAGYATAAAGGQADLLGSEPGATTCEEVTDVSTTVGVVHDVHDRPGIERYRGESSSPR